MAALLATDERLWLSNMVLVVPHNMKWIENPSSFSPFIHQALIHWAITQQLDTSMLYCPDNKLDTSSVSEQQSSCTDEHMHAFHHEGSAKDQGMQDVSDSDPGSVTVSKQQLSYRNSSQDDRNSCSTHTGCNSDDESLCDFDLKSSKSKHTLPESTLGLSNPTSLSYSKPKSTYMGKS